MKEIYRLKLTAELPPSYVKVGECIININNTGVEYKNTLIFGRVGTTLRANILREFSSEQLELSPE